MLWVGDGFAFLKMMDGSGEMRAVDQGVSTWGFELRFDIVEIDAGERLLDVQIAGLAVGVDAVPIEHPVSRIRVLLNFMNEKSRTDGMEPAGFDEQGIASFGSDGMNEIGDRAIGDGLLKCFTGCAAFQSDMEFGSG